MKGCAISKTNLKIKSINKIKVTVRYHYTLAWLLKKHLTFQALVKMHSNWNTQTLLAENSLIVSYNKNLPYNPQSHWSALPQEKWKVTVCRSTWKFIVAYSFSSEPRNYSDIPYLVNE